MPFEEVEAFISVDDAKKFMGITATDKDDLIGSSIDAASLMIANYLNLDPNRRTFIESFNGNGKTMMVLPNSPIISVASLKIDGATIPFSADKKTAGFVFTKTLIQLIGHVFSKGVLNVDVTYDAGFDEVPADIRQACLYTVNAAFKAGAVDPNATGESVPGVYSVSYAVGQSPGGLGGPGSIPPSAKALLQPHKRVTWP